MASPAEKERRQAIITKALLLGYTFHWGVMGRGVSLRYPEGKGSCTGWYIDDTIMPSVFPALWVAASKALELSGVPYEKAA